MLILFLSIRLYNHYYYGPNIVFESTDYNDIDVDCPCKSYPTIVSEILLTYHRSNTLCVIKANDYHYHLYALLKSYFNITFISAKSINNRNNCTHYITFKHINISSTAYNAITMKCPPECHHKPHIILPLNFDNLPATYRLTCSMTKETLIEALNIPSNIKHLYSLSTDSHNKYMYTHAYNISASNTSTQISIIHIIQLMMERRYQECHESQQYTSFTPTTAHTTNTTTVYKNAKSITYNTQYIFQYPRLKVEGLILWIGCLIKYDLGIQQMKILELQLQLQHANNTANTSSTNTWLHTRLIVGWLATEGIYTCYNNDIVYKCIHSNPRRNMPFVHLYGNNSLSDPKWRWAWYSC